jgi:hypothetical protein
MTDCKIINNGESEMSEIKELRIPEVLKKICFINSVTEGPC